MTQPRQSLIKPAVLNDVLKLPAKEMQQIMEKVAMLQTDPLPDGKAKKQLIHLPGKPYRIRSGNYRIFYNYNQQTVLIYKIDRRDESTYRDGVTPDNIPDTDEFDALESALTNDIAAPQRAWEKSASPAPSQPELISITAELLTALHVDEAHYSRLLSITDGDSLLACNGVDCQTLEKLMEYFYPRSLTEAMQQHNLVLNDIKDLQRYKEGDLLSFLLELSPEQEKYANWSMRTMGPTLVKGGPGTGKSTVALYRVRSLLEQLLKRGHDKPKILFTTYTTALIKASQQQLQQLLGDNALAYRHQSAHPQIRQRT
jgi:mRNA-degrading endonuclease RelE of RelBE toxin-antitoxin system